MNPDHNNDIDSLRRMLEGGGWVPTRSSLHAALTALVAERDRLKREIAEERDERKRLVAERDGLKQRVADLERLPSCDADYDPRRVIPSSDRDRELRERNALVRENILMEQRYTEALRKIEMLRERGTTTHQFSDANTLDAIESWMNAVTGMLSNHAMPHPNSMKDELASRRDAAIAAMRKGER